MTTILFTILCFQTGHSTLGVLALCGFVVNVAIKTVEQLQKKS